ncbi:MAG TPA: hypothetical protein VG755_01260 [Nannocystaceae bacterium]|nr:hypothetical protein [Nannocystaceae bacterium]
MTRDVLLSLVVFAGACRPLPPTSTSPQVAPAGSRAEEVWRSAVAVDGNSLWPGFDPSRTPLAIYDGRRTFLFGHPSPPSRYVAQASGVAVVDGRDEAVVANTAVDLAGVRTATMTLDDELAITEATALAIHEMFHVHQRERFAGWTADESAPFFYPVDDPTLLGWRLAEEAALRAAVATRAQAEMIAHARRALAIRARRFIALTPELRAYERKTELFEGIARYLQDRVAGRARMSAEGFAADDIRARAYAVGSMLATLLDRTAPDWKTKLVREPDATLDELLARAIGSESSDAALAAELERMAPEVDRRLAELRQRRAGIADELARTPGWTLRIDARRGRMRVASFDPMNVTKIDEQRVAHHRMVQAVGECSKLEDVGHPALVTASDPMGAQITELAIHGLADAPTVTREGDRLVVTGPDLSATLCHAELERDDAHHEIRVRLLGD